MSFIFLPTISSSSHKLNQAQFTNNSSPVFSGISIGDVFETGVIEKLGDRKVLITLKGVTIPAETEVSLNAGDKIRVEVERLHPQVILRIMETGSREESRIADYLKWHRSNPDALSSMMTEAMGHFNAGNLDKLLRFLPREDLQKIFTILKALFLSPQTRENTFFKDYLNNLGLLTESQLRMVLEGESGIDEGNTHPQNLKSLFIKLSEDIRILLTGKGTLSPEGSVLLKSLSEYVDSSIKTIESQQVINYVLQESESKYLFQIPILLPEGVRKGDIFVEYDRNTGEKGQKEHYRIIIFLSMDILGDMIIDTHLKGDKINCLIKCIDQEVRDFISSFLEELREKLFAMGCEIDTVECVAGGNLLKEKNDYYQDRVLYAREVIDLFA
jgi:hypothetical protein